MDTPQRLTLRVPPDLYDRIQDAAEIDRRSANNEILWLIERGLDCQEWRK